jgi:hypothetical protein
MQGNAAMVAGDGPAIISATPLGSHLSDSTRALPEEDVCVLVSSCDAYSDAWDPFFALFRRFWPDCPYPIRLISNTLQPDFPGVQSLPIGADRAWAGNMLVALQQLPHRYFLYFQEDYFLQAPVDTTQVRRVLEFAGQTGAGFIRLSGAPNPDQKHANSLGLGLLSAAVKFRVSLQAACWQRDLLTALLVDGETGWEMEIAGTVRSRSLNTRFFSVHSRRPVFDYYRHTGILKGKWVPGALRLCQREGVTVDTSRREIHGEWPFLVKDVRDTTVVSACRRWLRRLRGRAA